MYHPLQLSATFIQIFTKKMDQCKVLGQHGWLKNPLRLILAWILFMLHTNIPSAQTIHHRIYTLNPSEDTFLNGPTISYFQREYVELGVRDIGLLTGQESRTLFRFDVDQFKKDSHWGKEDNFNHLNETTLTSATLTMYCQRVADSSGNGNDIYSDTIHLARVLKSWEQDKVTETQRNAAGEEWSEPNLATDGRDATASLQSIAVSVDSQTCTAGESFTFNLTDIFSDWLEGRAENHGIILWAENVRDTRMVLWMVSSDGAQVEKHPVLEVQLQDTIHKSYECPKEELQCIDGNCIPQTKFVIL
ncbi:uncharacterized protein [Amphiura filiformis]|uniref:uncharacterized protein n=1 Tax=Amphiura filiformis TaxID=82378 RepID=UPI003B225EF2